MKKLKSNVDRISQLPDAVLGHILSYVPTKQYLQTSVLSKQWLHVWRSVAFVDIDDSELLVEPIIGTDQRVLTSFVNFIINVFDRSKEASIRKFTLKCSKFDVVRVNSWILAAVKHRVRELDLCITLRESFKMTSGLFAYQELVALKLGENLILNDPGILCFPSLKKLHLHNIAFDGNFVCNFLSSCPVLEDLHLEEFSTVNLDTLFINAPALKFLTMENNCEGGCKFTLETPNLEVLNYSSYSAIQAFCFKNLKSLVKADINVNMEFVDDYYHEDEKNSYIPYALEMVKGLANAKNLSLSGGTLEFFCLSDAHDWPIFHNLSELRLAGNEYCGTLLPQLLHNSPNLEVLVIDQGLGGYLGDFKWERPSSVPECLSLNLKVVNIWGFYAQKYLGQFIRYLLLHAKVLNEFSAAPKKSEHKEIKLSEQLLTYLMAGKARN